MKIGFVGLGKMGHAMAKNLLGVGQGPEQTLSVHPSPSQRGTG